MTIEPSGTTASPGGCLNCGSELAGPFCSSCGQRAIAAYPTVAEMIGDAWHELSGYDGRIVRTVRMLVRSPGALTVDTLEGRRARYLSPVRLYLIASLTYFLCAAAVPNLRNPDAVVMPGSHVNIQMDGSGRVSGLSDENRVQALKDLERAPWWAQRMLRPVLLDPDGFRVRFLQTLPRVLFALVPLAAAIVAVFYRRRRFTQHLIFAVHLHATVFLALTLRELSQLTRSPTVVGIFGVATMLSIAGYGLLAFRRVYHESWPRIVAKAAGIAAIYGLAGLAALVATMIWATTSAG
jgi:hypothetical protein